MAHDDQRASRGRACLLIAAALLAAVTGGVLLGLTDDLDAAARAAVNGMATPRLTALVESLTLLGSWEVVYALAVATVIVLWLIERRRAALQLTLVMAAAAILNNAIKWTMARERPPAFFSDSPESYSFPSGHALFAGCYYGVMAALVAPALPRAWQRGAVLAAAALLIGSIGLTRVYLGVHHPTDVLAGFALAALIICVIRGLSAGRAGDIGKV